MMLAVGSNVTKAKALLLLIPKVLGVQVTYTT